MTRSVRWAERCRRRLAGTSARGRSTASTVSNAGQAQFGIVQGGVFQDLRDESADATVAVGFEGYAIGGLSVGEPSEQMYARRRARRAAAAAGSAPLPDGCRHARGPRRVRGRGHRHVRLRAADAQRAQRPAVHESRVESTSRTPSTPRTTARSIRHCGCYTCRHHSRAYLRHLYMAGEMSAGALNTLHNLSFYLDTMRRIRDAIAFRTFDSFRQEFLRSASRLSLDS